jgi:hypothetical protein
MARFDFVVDAATERLNVSLNLCQPPIDSNKALVDLGEAFIDLSKALVDVRESITYIPKLSRTQIGELVDQGFEPRKSLLHLGIVHSESLSQPKDLASNWIVETVDSPNFSGELVMWCCTVAQAIVARRGETRSGSIER